MTILRLESEAWCRKAYLDYHCHGKKMGITDEEMGIITATWSNRLTAWQEYASSDENEYDFDDSEYSRYREQAKANAQQETGYKKYQFDDGMHAATETIGAVGGVVAQAGGAKLMGAIGKEVAKETGKEIGKEVGKASMKEASKQTAEQGLKNLSAYVAIGFGIATAAAYWIKRPNKDEHEAAQKLMPQMATSQDELTTTQDNMNTMSEELIGLSDEAYNTNEDANNDFKEQKADYDKEMQTYLELQAKIDAGESLTESEKATYQDVVKILQEFQEIFDDTTEKTTEKVNDIYDEMETYQARYDEASTTMANVEGLTDYAESFDKTAEVLCYVDGGAQSLNAGSTGIAAGRLMAISGAAWWNYAIAAAGLVAAGSSGYAASEQFRWGADLTKEVKARSDVQKVNLETSEQYVEEIDVYDSHMDTVSGLEMNVPETEDIEISTPTTENNTQPEPQPSEESEDPRRRREEEA